MDRQSFPRSVLRLFGACLLLGVTGMMLAELHALPFFSVAGLRSAESGCGKCAEHLLRAWEHGKGCVSDSCQASPQIMWKLPLLLLPLLANCICMQVVYRSYRSSRKLLFWTFEQRRKKSVAVRSGLFWSWSERNWRHWWHWCWQGTLTSSTTRVCLLQWFVSSHKSFRRKKKRCCTAMCLVLALLYFWPRLFAATPLLSQLFIAQNLLIASHVLFDSGQFC